ncbi:hypothetical protein [Achromobacter spanius]|uniref:hypothetical protein n=1 Tax=Achromobacter spanius TaxID=217203 RepID=UPI0032085B4A
MNRLAVFSATRMGWLPLLLVWAVGPFLFVAVDIPPTIRFDTARINFIGWFGALLYAAFGTWMLARDYRGLAVKDGRRFNVAASIWLLGIMGSVLTGAMSVSIAEWINSTSRDSTMQRSLLLGYYSREHKPRRGSRYITITSYVVPYRDEPKQATIVEGLAGARPGNNIIHLCMTEHVGRLGWYWYENVRDCDEPPKQFALAWLERQRISAQAFVDQGGKLDAEFTAIPLIRKRYYTAIVSGESPKAVAKAVETAPTDADQARVGADLLALGRQLPLPDWSKSDATVKAWNDRYILVQLESKLLLYDRAHNAWIYLKAVDGSPIGLYDRSVWLFGQDGRSLYQHRRESFGMGEFDRWNLVDSRPEAGRNDP